MSSSTLIAVIAVAAVVVIALTVALWAMARRRHLQHQFGPEYDRTVEAEGGRMAAERELRAREQRHDKLEIKELPAERRDLYATEWSTVQEHFVDRPEGSVEEADELVSRLMRERGYPTDDYSGQLRDLSVEHGRTLEHYRAAHDVKVRSADQRTTTEELRGAMVHYRALFDDLLTDQRSR
ncbi:hypothetical protein PV721_05400 [Streptomyces sp. MB09-01]|uniref:hypothetical protein n=1 Tax=Streptomyces sp. MB09-01 TaxID=3028666 RepID=UPI0029B67F62|nr:hypothetical protein [Streptomyces sp. MB09-01]MDX3533809.1 hypothetical protein [Streptomyces sp. MB09-01]